MIMKKRVFFILFTLMFTVPGYSNIEKTKVSITIDSSDVALFYSVLDEARENGIEIDGAYFYDNYVAKGSLGLKNLYSQVNFNANQTELSDKDFFLKSYEPYFSFLEANRYEIIKNQELYRQEQLDEVAEKLAVFLDEDFNSTFYFLIGPGGMYGTAFSEGVIIDISMLKTDRIDYSTHFFPDIKNYLPDKKDSLFIFVHEVMHQLQEIYIKRENVTKTSEFRDIVLNEGGANFFAKTLLSEENIYSLYKKQDEYFKNNPQIMEKFLDEKNTKEDIEKWFFNFLSVSGTDVPADMGYFLGAVICQDYYDRAENKKKAFIEIVRYWETKDAIIASYQENNLK